MRIQGITPVTVQASVGRPHCRFSGFLLWLSLLLVPQVQAGEIQFSFVNVALINDQYVMDAHAAVELNGTIEAGLKSGVPLFFDATGSVLRVRPFLWDQKVSSFNRRYSLVYYELTRHYRVSAVGEDKTRNFRSLFDALDYLGTIQDLPVVPVNRLDEAQYRGEVHFSLDTSALPLQLTTQTLVSSAWRLRSETFSWLLN